MKEKIIRRAQVELEQGHDIKVALESGKSPDFDSDKPHLEIIEIEEIMAESDGVNKDEVKFYTPSREPTEKEKRKLELVQERFNKAFDNAYERFENRKETFKENMKKIYMKIYDEYCTTAMQNRLQQHPQFNTNLVDDPIETLRTIELLIHNPVRVVYPFEALTDALRNFLLARQNKGETTIDYIKR